MTTTSPPPLSPSRRGKVAWSQHTSYPGAAGVHSEVGPTARSLQVTGRHQLQANLTSLHSLHHKELRRLHLQRKALQVSMLAYAHKMRDISSGKLLADSPTLQDNSEPARSGRHSRQRKGGQSSYFDQTRTHSGQDDNDKVLTQNKSKESDDKETETRSRISVDSGIDVTEAWVEQPSKTGRQRVSLPALNTSSPEPAHKPRPASFHASERKQFSRYPHQTDSLVANSRPSSFHIAAEIREESVRGTGPYSAVLPASNRARQRRSGTNQSPNMLFQKFSVENNQHHAENADPDNLEFLLALPDPADVLPSISPFPEFSHESKVDAESEMASILAGRRKSTQIPSPLPLSPAKLKKTKQQYWSLKKTQIDRRSLGKNSKSFGKFRRQPPSSLSPRQSSLRNSKKSKDKSLPTKVSFQRSFRYSEAVDNLLKSFDDCKLEMVDQVCIRRAADYLPTLDIEGLKEERTRMKQQRRNTPKHAQNRKLPSGSVFPSTQNYDDTKHDVKEDRVDRDEGSDVRSDYGSDDGSLVSFVSSQENTSDEELGGSREADVWEGEGETEGYSDMGKGKGDGLKVLSVRKAGHVSFTLPAIHNN